RALAWLAAGALAGLGCGARGPEMPELAKPVYSWSWTRGGCGGRRALDGDGRLWTLEGCDDGRPRLVRGPQASPTQRVATVGAFARLPEPRVATCTTPTQEFQIDAGGRVRTWDICDVADPSALTGPFAEVPRAFQGAAPR